MSNTIDIVESDDQVLAPAAVTKRMSLAERGMVTIEYAIGAVLVLVLVGVIIASIQQGWFSQLVQQLITLLMQNVGRALGA